MRYVFIIIYIYIYMALCFVSRIICMNIVKSGNEVCREGEGKERRTILENSRIVCFIND